MIVAPMAAEIESFRGLVAERLGLHFEDAKMDFLADVLRKRMEDTGCSCFSAYQGRISCSHGERDEVCALTFTPAATGARTASVTITDNACGSAHSVSLTGTGTDFALSAASGGNCPSGGNCATSATISAGSTATYDLQVTPNSGFNGSVALACLFRRARQLHLHRFPGIGSASGLGKLGLHGSGREHIQRDACTAGAFPQGPRTAKWLCANGLSDPAVRALGGTA